MKRWLYLSAAIVSEIIGTMALRATLLHPAWGILVIAGYALAFAGLAGALRSGMTIGVAYGIWGASGVALTAVIAALLFNEPLTTAIGIGIALIIVGVLLVEIGSRTTHQTSASKSQPIGNQQ